ncbi:MAG: carbohydrate ABC transporter permease [Monoglobaceae bacterium]
MKVESGKQGMTLGRLKRFKKNYVGWLFAIPTIILFYFFVWRPIIIAISYSFFELKGFTPTNFVGLENYRIVLQDTNFLQTLLNTGKYVFFDLIIEVPLAFISAVLLNEMVHCKQYFKVVLYLPAIIPMVVSSVLWKAVYMDGAGGLLNMLRYYLFGAEPMQFLTDKNLVIPLIIIKMAWSGFGGSMIMYLASLQGVDKSLYEAARLEGAGLFSRIRYVMMPRMYGILLLVVIRQMIGIAQLSQEPLIMTGGGPNGASMSIGLQNYIYAFQYNQYSKSISLGVVTFLGLMIVTLIYFVLDRRVND